MGYKTFVNTRQLEKTFVNARQHEKTQVYARRGPPWKVFRLAQMSIEIRSEDEKGLSYVQTEGLQGRDTFSLDGSQDNCQPTTG